MLNRPIWAIGMHVKIALHPEVSVTVKVTSLAPGRPSCRLRASMSASMFGRESWVHREFVEGASRASSGGTGCRVEAAATEGSPAATEGGGEGEEA